MIGLGMPAIIPKSTWCIWKKRMVQSGHWPSSRRLDEQAFRRLARERIETVSLTQARREVEPFVKDTGSLSVWSKEFFLDVLQRTKVI
jgi:hypothetical protein